MKNRELRSRLELAVSSAQKAGFQILNHFRRDDKKVEQKPDGTPVTPADREAETILRTQIERAFPADGIAGEEFPERPGQSGYRWILDPIDGTRAFARGVPLFGTMIGVEYEKKCVVGVVLLPALDEIVYAARGMGTWHARGSEEPRRIRVSEVKQLADAVFCTTSVDEFFQADRQDVYDLLRTSCRFDRGWGDCYGYVLVATGRADIMIDPELSLWDMAALPPILEEAGGTFTNWQGKPTIYGREGLATNGHLLHDVLAITRGH